MAGVSLLPGRAALSNLLPLSGAMTVTRRILSDAWLIVVVTVALAAALGCIYALFILPQLFLGGVMWLTSRRFLRRRPVNSCSRKDALLVI
jgi:hypothetical protein